MFESDQPTKRVKLLQHEFYPFTTLEPKTLFKEKRRQDISINQYIYIYE